MNTPPRSPRQGGSNGGFVAPRAGHSHPSMLYMIIGVLTVLSLFNTFHIVTFESKATWRGDEPDSYSNSFVTPNIRASAPAPECSLELAHKQSFGLLDDITDKSWQLMKKRVKNRVNHQNPLDPLEESYTPKAWYQKNFEPDFSCPHEERVGGMGDGGKWVCNPHRLREMGLSRKEEKGHGCLIYSIGSEGNFMFETGIAKLLGDNPPCEIHVFDPTNYGAAVPEQYKDFIFYHAWGLKSSVAPPSNLHRRTQEDEPDNPINTEASQSSEIVDESSVPRSFEGEMDVYQEPEPNLQDFTGQYQDPQAMWTMYSIQEIVEKLGHTNRVIDVFKIDCENCEWETYTDWLSADVDIRQILVEVHNVPYQAVDFFKSHQNAGYVTFHKEPNTQYADGNCQEYCFLKLDKGFFSELEDN